MKYIARPVEVEAFTIEKIIWRRIDGDVGLRLDSGQEVTATAAMCSRMNPQAGDYWVISLDGYTYLNPKKTFESKYRPKDQ